MDNYLSEIHAENVFGRLNFDLKFNPELNVIHAENGAGKTTLLHILANALNGDFYRFAYLNFTKISLLFANKDEIQISRINHDSDSYITIQVNGKVINMPVSIERTRDRRVHPDQLPLFDQATNSELKEMGVFEPILTAGYFPAFRTMIEAWSNANEEERYTRSRSPEYIQDIEVALRRNKGLSRVEARFQALSTFEARRAFGEFVPVISYPSPLEITRSLSEEFQRALIIVANKDRELLSQVFIDVFKVLSDSSSSQYLDLDVDQMLEDIDRLLSDDQQKDFFQTVQDVSLSQTDAYSRLKEAIRSTKLKGSGEVAAPVVNVYRDSLIERSKTRADAFKELEMYLSSVNEFISDDKSIVLFNTERRTPAIGIRFADKTTLNGLRALSSGERQIVTLIYAATRMSTQDVILIDEPEISLHIDWQRILLKTMVEQLGERQIIVCTHSPQIGADYIDHLVKLSPTYTLTSQVSNTTEIDDLDDNETY